MRGSSRSRVPPETRRKHSRVIVRRVRSPILTGVSMDSGSIAWVLVSAALVLFMTPGLAFFYGGMDRGKNVLNMLMMNFYCLLIVPLLWVAVGYSLSSVPFDNDIIGNFDSFFLKDISTAGDGGAL